MHPEINTEARMAKQEAKNSEHFQVFTGEGGAVGLDDIITKAVTSDVKVILVGEVCLTRQINSFLKTNVEKGILKRRRTK